MQHDAWAELADRVRHDLTAWQPDSASQADARRDCLTLLRDRGGAAVRKDAGSVHVTASCFLLSPDRESVLLTLHRKAGRWLQLGGHLEVDDADAAGAARREAVEEGGVHAISLLSPVPVDVDRQVLQGDFGTCRVHWDIGYVAVADTASTPRVSAESHDVRWWRVDRLRQADLGLTARLDAALSLMVGRP